MKNILAKQLISKLLKQADMPLPGASYTADRSQQRNLRFVVFNRNKFRQSLIDLPEELKQRLANAMDGYYNSFAKYLRTDAEKAKYSGMTKIAVAKDTHVSRDVITELEKNNPQLMETAKFIDQYNIQLPTDADTLRSKLPRDREGGIISKAVGSDYWLKIFGYAYYDLMYKGEPLEVERLLNARRREIKDNPTQKEFAAGINGRFKIGQVENGYTFIIEKDDSRFIDENGQRNRETTIVFDPDLQIATQMQAKWFDVPVTMNKSCVIYDDADPKNITVINCAAAEKLRTTDPATYSKVYKIYADEDTGAFYLRKQNNFGAGAGKRFFTSEPLYLNYEQVLSLANKSRINQMCIVIPPSPGQVDVVEDDLSFEEMQDRYKYIYRFTDATKQKLLNAKPGDREYPYSIPALINFRQYLDAKANDATQGETPRAHTALEGYIVFMVAPIFVNPENVAPGKTRGGPLTTKYEYIANLNKPLEVDRVKFGVYKMYISPARLEAAGRVTKQGKLRLPMFRTVTVEDTIDAALKKMEGLMTGFGAKFEYDETGEAVPVPMVPGIQKSRGTELAQELLERSMGKNKPAEVPAPNAPQQNPVQQNPPQNKP